jgi:uncharacterized protein YbjQ (UPF0145 family)
VFGKKDARTTVPVFTVQTTPRSFELIKTILTLHSGQKAEDYSEALIELGKIASEMGADAVIGATFTPTVGTVSRYIAMGTAIKCKRQIRRCMESTAKL